MGQRLHLSEGYGIELEYMIVHRETLDILPVSDEVFQSVTGNYETDYNDDNMGWSNEFVLHVIELRNIEPVPSVSLSLISNFRKQIHKINAVLEPMGGILMPTSMHPWMDPKKEARLWHHGNRHIYETYDGIFGCKTHGFANIQSMQLNLSFLGDKEFGRLHAAVRLLIPLIPAIAASSPLVEGVATGFLDNRVIHYRQNQSLVPSISGNIIPEAVYTRGAYKKEILQRMYDDVAPFDKKKIISHEWLNSRGAIARFERSAIELRIPDIQECPEADGAVAWVTASLIKSLASEQWTVFKDQASFSSGSLLSIFEDILRLGGQAVIKDTAYLRMFGYPDRDATADELWHYFLSESVILSSRSDRLYVNTLRRILDHGSLAQRILRALRGNQSREQIRDVYRALSECLSAGEMFIA